MDDYLLASLGTRVIRGGRDGIPFERATLELERVIPCKLRHQPGVDVSGLRR